MRHTHIRYDARGCGLSVGAYRWQYIVSGVQNDRFLKILGDMVTTAQMGRIVAALAPIMGEAAA